MLDVIQILTDKFIERLIEGYRTVFGQDYDTQQEYEHLIVKNAEHVIQTIATGNTLYHNVEHTIQVTLVGQAILQGKILANESVSPEIWLNFMMSLLCHDIGYASGIYWPEDQDDVDKNASNAVLMPIHINRGKRFVEEAFCHQKSIDTDFIQQCIERTRFPVPEGEEYQCSDDFPGLVRGADLIGQLSDPRYINKLPAVFFEFEESGYNEFTGYKQPGDLLTNYAEFYQNSVEPYVQETLEYLSMTPLGRDIIASHDANLSVAKENSHGFSEELSMGSQFS